MAPSTAEWMKSGSAHFRLNACLVSTASESSARMLIADIYDVPSSRIGLNTRPHFVLSPGYFCMENNVQDETGKM